MASVKIYDMMDWTDKYFVGTYTHMNDISEHMLREEIDDFAKRRIDWLQRMYEKGSRVKTASER